MTEGPFFTTVVEEKDAGAVNSFQALSSMIVIKEEALCKSPCYKVY